MIKPISFMALFTMLFMGCASAQQAGEWAEQPGPVLNTVLPTVAELGQAWCTETRACPGHPLDDWTSLSFNEDTRQIFDIRPGGHEDAGGADSYMLDLDNLAAGWSRVEPVQHLTGPVDANGCPWPAYGSPAVHNYDQTPWVGGTRYYYMGNPPFCLTAYGPSQAWEVDTSTTPWTWTERLDLRLYAPGGSAVYGGNLYLANGAGKSAVVTIATGAIASSGTQFRGVIINGVEQQSSSGYGSSMTSMGVNSDGVWVQGDKFYLNVGRVNGTRVNCPTNTAATCNDDSFPRSVRRPVGTLAPAGSIQSELFGFHSVTAVPDGRFVFWNGGKKIITLRVVDPKNAALDVWEKFDPATGPTDGTLARTYDKLFWDAQTGMLVGVSNKSQGVWFFNLPGTAPVNQPPVANDDAFVGAEDTGIAGNVLTNDTDDAGPLTATGDGINPDGSFAYTPAANFSGEVLLTYTASDGELTDTATVTLTIAPVDDPAVVVGEAATVEEEGTLNGTVAANDSDVDSPLVYEFAAVDGLTGNPDGSYTYIGPVDFFGVVDVGYTANGIPGTLTITVTDVAEPNPLENLSCTFSFDYQDTLPAEFDPPTHCTVTGQADPPPPPPPEEGAYGLPPTATLAQVCAQPGTLLCDPLDDTTPVSGAGVTGNHNLLLSQAMMAGTYGDWRSSVPAAGKSVNIVDTTMGNGGSLRFTISPGLGIPEYKVNPTDHFGGGAAVGQTVTMRFRVRYSCDMIYLDCDPNGPTYKTQIRKFLMANGATQGGFKIAAFQQTDVSQQIIIDGGEGVSGVVCGDYKGRKFWACYIAIWFKGVEQSYPKINGITQWDLQPGGPNICWRNDPVTGLGLTERWPACFTIEADEWMTVQMELAYGPCTSNVGDLALASHYRMWIAHEGQPFELVTDQPINLRCYNSFGSVPNTNPQMGTVIFTPFVTGKDQTEQHPTGYVWYDDLWIRVQ